ncbi:MAG: NADH-quinone oxidoreductase subunit I [Thermaerobacter sp.]|nr:NADH-quinone oxidoreductase subunit I [Thermaerobacter sp.]MDA8146286.1 NADH-quinone oxidoreductase subunit I [Thermaerobacter sp.]
MQGKHLFLGGILQGLGVTLRHLLRPPVTIQYPDELPPLPGRFRGRQDLDAARCTSCGLCAKACPVDCIQLSFHVGENKKRVLDSFQIDFSRCLFCGLCSEVCPPQCLPMGPEFELAAADRDGLVLAAPQLAPTAGLRRPAAGKEDDRIA